MRTILSWGGKSLTLKSVAAMTLSGACCLAQASLIGDTIHYEGWYPSRNTIYPGAIDTFVVQAGLADLHVFGGATFNVEAQSIDITSSGTGVAGFGSSPCNCIFLSDLDPGFSIAGYSLSTMLPGLTASSIEVTSSTFLFDFTGVTFGANQTFTVTLLPVPEPDTSMMMLAGLGLLGYLARRKQTA